MYSIRDFIALLCIGMLVSYRILVGVVTETSTVFEWNEATNLLMPSHNDKNNKNGWLIHCPGEALNKLGIGERERSLTEMVSRLEDS